MADVYVSTGGNDTTGNGSSGTPYASPGKAAGVMSAGDRMLVKSGTYTISSATANVAGGIVAPPAGSGEQAMTQVIGYGTTVGDYAARPIFRMSNSLTSSALAIVAATFRMVIDNIEADAGTAGNASVSGFTTSGFNCYFRRLKASNCKVYGIEHSSTGAVEDCYATGCSGTGAIYIDGAASVAGCIAHANACTGIYSNGGGVVRCRSTANTGGSSDGFSGGFGGGLRDGCTAYGNGRHGFDCNASVVSTYRNCLAYGNAGYGWNTAGGGSRGARLLNCAGGSNTSGNYTSGDWPFVESFAVLSADPFTNAAGADFSLNSTAGGGAACRAAGFQQT